MRARSSSEIASVVDARALLGLDGPVEAVALTAAFRDAVKSARPDGPGGDEVRFRRVIAAWRLLQAEDAPLSLAAPTSTSDRASSPPPLTLTPAQAMNGGSAIATADGRALRVRLPAGLRAGDRLRLKRASADSRDLHLPILIRPSDGLSVLGDDVYMTWPVAPRVLVEGGRIEIETHVGPRSAWIVAGQSTLRLRLKNLGLPPRGKHPRGHLFVSLAASEDAPSAAEDLLIRFTRVWTPDRLAA